MEGRPMLQAIVKAKLRLVPDQAICRAIALISEVQRHITAELARETWANIGDEDVDAVIADVIADLERHREELLSVARYAGDLSL